MEESGEHKSPGGVFVFLPVLSKRRSPGTAAAEESGLPTSLPFNGTLLARTQKPSLTSTVRDACAARKGHRTERFEERWSASHWEPSNSKRQFSSRDSISGPPPAPPASGEVSYAAREARKMLRHFCKSAQLPGHLVKLAELGEEK